MGGLGIEEGAASALSLSFQRESFIMGLVNVLLLSGGDTLRIGLGISIMLSSKGEGGCVLEVAMVAMGMGEGAEGLSSLALSDTMTI
jgi:hypothetical protein